MENLCKILKKDIVFFDLETTGVDIKNDQIIEIYAIKISPNGERAEYHQYIKPTIPISKSAFEAHGITTEFLEEYPTMSEVASDIFNFVKKCDLGGFNCLKFDIPFLFEELSKHGIILPFNVSIVDSYNLVNKMEPRTLGDIYKGYFGKPIENSHSAKQDTEATVDIFIKQLEKYEFGDNAISNISNIIRSDKENNRIVDLSGWFKKINGSYYYNRGTHKDTLVFGNIDYLRWMIGSSFVENNSRLIASKLYEMHEKL